MGRQLKLGWEGLDHKPRSLPPPQANGEASKGPDGAAESDPRQGETPGCVAGKPVSGPCRLGWLLCPDAGLSGPHLHCGCFWGTLAPWVHQHPEGRALPARLHPSGRLQAPGSKPTATEFFMSATAEVNSLKCSSGQ